jgi:Flp pilus assembly protein TadG
MILKLRHILRFGRNQEGSVAVEFALCILPLLLIVGGIMDFGHLFYVEHLITNASREGARYASRYTGASTEPTSDEISTYVRTTLNYDSFNLDDFNVSGSYTGSPPNKIATVTVQAKKYWWILTSFLSTKQLTSTTAMTVERL